jgi:hypothetical protein
MSRKTKKDKSSNYGVAENGQVVRLDTIVRDPEKYSTTRHYKHGEVQQPDLDLDHTREHREEIRAIAARSTKTARLLKEVTR